MKKLQKLFIALVFLIPFFSFGQLQDYLDAENARQIKADSLEVEIGNYIIANLGNYTLPQSVIDAVTDDLTNHQDEVTQTVSQSDINLALDQIKSDLLREDYLQKHPGASDLFNALLPSPELMLTCINGGFENAPDNYANYTFRSVSTVGGHLSSTGCTDTINNQAFAPTGVNQFNALASVVNPGNEPLLNQLNIQINRVHTGTRALKLNSTPNNWNQEQNQGSAVRVFRNVTINGPTMEFSFLQIGHVVPDNDHEQPFFRYRILDPANNNAVLRTRCIEMNFNDCRYTQIPDTRGGFGGYTLAYTNQWICERINTADLIGRNLVVEFTASDCEFRGHFCTVYIDDLCGQACTPTWGSLLLNPVNQLCPISPFQVCGTLQLPAGVTLTTGIALSILDSNGNAVKTLSNPTFTGQNFCFTVSPLDFGENPSGTYTFQVNATTSMTSGNCTNAIPLTDEMGMVNFNACCTATLTTANTINTTVYQRRESWIKSTDLFATPSARGVYHAGDYVELNPGFETDSQANFSAYVLGCPNTFYYRGGQEDAMAISEPEKSVPETKLVKLSENLSVYPNPSNGEITVSSQNSEMTSLFITAIDGKRIFSSEAKGKEMYIDVSHFMDGLYIITVRTVSGKTATLKFIKN